MNDLPQCPSEDDLDPDVRDMIACIRGHTMVTLPRLISLVQQVRHCECLERRLHWTRGAGGTMGRLTPLTGFYDAFGGPGTLAENRNLLEQTIQYDARNIHYHHGWFQDTLPVDAAAVGPIAILRLDGDWYASTKACLEHLYDQVVPSGFVIVDDYDTYDGCRKAVDEFIASRSLPVQLHRVDADCRYWVKD
ncbi:MAG: TylF/MycF/NovP-related O-methyltransferase [Planctomycetia bacterium]